MKVPVAKKAAHAWLEHTGKLGGAREWETVKQRIAKGEMTQVEAARHFGVSPYTILRWKQDDQNSSTRA